MSISIITPHYNDFEGLRKVYGYLLTQTEAVWEWVVVDDFSNDKVRNHLECYFNNLSDPRIKLLLNSQKSNASVCRNIGADASKFQYLVFLDADDSISPGFIARRQIEFIDFAVFKNTGVISKNGEEHMHPSIKENFLNHFLRAQFIWPITSILWDKDFFNTIGKFHSKLPRLQDVELVIRALQKSTNYDVLDNPVDFYYRVKPIRERKNFVQPVCEAVYLFISELLDTTNINEEQIKLLSGYYYICTKYFERAETTMDAAYVRMNLKLFYKKRYITNVKYTLGTLVLQLYKNKLISGRLFLRANRSLFKPK
jgi:glycosyltransferase involved in cell wall biosynthesis